MVIKAVAIAMVIAFIALVAMYITYRHYERQEARRHELRMTRDEQNHEVMIREFEDE